MLTAQENRLKFHQNAATLPAPEGKNPTLAFIGTDVRSIPAVYAVNGAQSHRPTLLDRQVVSQDRKAVL